MRHIDDVDGSTAADVMHRRMTSLPASATVGEVRSYFAESDSRQLAVLADGARYVGSIVAAELDAEAGDAAPAARFAQPLPAIHPDASARSARDLALQQPSRRLPVVDDAGKLCGVVAITRDRDGFCGT
jgi:CBS domain-containing protein